MTDEVTERIQKILARAGIASRRKAEELIADGEVTVNGRVAKLGDKARWGRDAIKVKGKLLHTVEPPVYLAFHKPKGVISMLADPEGRPTLASYLSKVKTRVFPVGRLDYNSEGLILLTNDGEVAEKLQKQDNIVRVYQVKVKGHPTPEMIERLSKGGRIGPRRIEPHSVKILHEYASKALIEFVLIGSGAADLKTYFEQKGFLVERLIRTAIGHITLHSMLPGQFRYLKPSQMQALLNQPELGVRKLEENKSERPTQSAARAAATRQDRHYRSTGRGDRETRAPQKPRVRIIPKTKT